MRLDGDAKITCEGQCTGGYADKERRLRCWMMGGAEVYYSIKDRSEWLW